MTVYTFGYAGRTLDHLRGHVQAHDGVVIDIRYQPFSRATPEWGRQALAETFAGRYAWIRSFGNVNYKGGPIRIADYAEGLIQLTRRLKAGESPILLCVCGRVSECHRTTVATRLSVDLGATIVHLDQRAPRPTTGNLFD